MAWAIPRGGELTALDAADSHALAQLSDGCLEIEQYAAAVESFVSSQQVQYRALSVVAEGHLVFEIDMEERVAIVADSVVDQVFGSGDAVRLVSVDLFTELDGARAFVDGVEEPLDTHELNDHLRSFFENDVPPTGQEYAAMLCNAILVTDLAGETVGTLVAGRLSQWVVDIQRNQWLMSRALEVILNARLSDLRGGEIDSAVRERVSDMCREAMRRLSPLAGSVG